MPNINEYPKDFTAYQLQKPTPPQKTYTQAKEVYRCLFDIAFKDIVKCDWIAAEDNSLVFYVNEECENPNYAVESECYEKKLKRYEKQLEIQAEYLPKWNAEVAAEKEKYERDMLAKLKVKYESNS